MASHSTAALGVVVGMLSTLFMLLRLTVGWVHAARPLSCMDPSAHPTPLGCCSLCQPLLVSGVVLAMDSRLRSRMGASETTQSLADMCNPPQTASATLVVSASCLARVAPHVLCSVRNGTQPHALESDMHEGQTAVPQPCGCFICFAAARRLQLSFIVFCGRSAHCCCCCVQCCRPRWLWTLHPVGLCLAAASMCSC